MDVGERVRLRMPMRGHENVRGEIIEVGEPKSSMRHILTSPPVLVRWDGHDREVWYLADDLLPLLP